MELKPFKITFRHIDNVIHALATPFQNEDFIFYEIFTADQSFTIKPNQTESDRLKWTDLRGRESELFTSAGEAIEKATT